VGHTPFAEGNIRWSREIPQNSEKKEPNVTSDVNKPKNKVKKVIRELVDILCDPLIRIINSVLQLQLVLRAVRKLVPSGSQIGQL